MSSEAENYLRKAHRKISSAKKIIQMDEYDDALSRAYYAMFLAAKAILLTRGSSPRTHEGLIREFGRLVVKTGELPEKLGQDLVAAKALREKSDHAPTFEADRDIALEVLRKAEDFVGAVAKRINFEGPR